MVVIPDLGHVGDLAVLHLHDEHVVGHKCLAGGWHGLPDTRVGAKKLRESDDRLLLLVNGDALQLVMRIRQDLQQVRD